MEDQKHSLKIIEEAREIVESIGETCPVYVGFEKSEYIVTGKQMQKIAEALYSADCELYNILNKT